jgi:hypothetical protein
MNEKFQRLNAAHAAQKPRRGGSPGSPTASSNLVRVPPFPEAESIASAPTYDGITSGRVITVDQVRAPRRSVRVVSQAVATPSASVVTVTATVSRRVDAARSRSRAPVKPPA